jgi:uncharacterized protein (TIGR02246 family)
MRTTLSAFSLALGVALTLVRPIAGFAQGTPADRQAIRNLIQAHADAWNRRDAKAAAAVMAPDAVWITSSGTILQGRTEIERAHREWLSEDSAAGGSTHVHPAESIKIRFLRADVAVADLASQFIARPKRGALPPTPETTYLFIVVTKDRGIWRISQLRNTLAPHG